MKITINDVIYKGVYIDELICTLPEHVKRLEDIDVSQIESYIKEHLENHISDEEND